MKVSFDLDEVLFVDPKRFEIEKPPRGLAGLFYKERLRKGTVNLMHKLQSEGFEIWVYTSSYRSVQYIDNLFRLYGVRFDGIVNAQRHEMEVQGGHRQRLPQKKRTYCWRTSATRSTPGSSTPSRLSASIRPRASWPFR